MSSFLPAGGAVPKEARPSPVACSQPERRLLQLYPDDSDASATMATIIDIIAIHGLETDGQITWKHNNGNIGNPVNWLRDNHMLPDRVPESRIMTYDWNATIRKGVSTLTLAEEATRLIETVLRDRSEKHKNKSTCPILFIASCFGGLLLAKVLIEAKCYYGEDYERYREIFNSIRGIVFLGTPFRGSWKFGTEFINKRVEQAKEKGEDYSLEYPQYLKPTESYLPSPLNDLTRSLEYIVKERGSSLLVTCFSESRKSGYVSRLRNRPDEFRLPGKDEDGAEITVDEWVKNIKAQDGFEIVVDRYSASIEGAKKVALNLSHNMMNKFNDPKGQEFGLVVGELERFARLALSAKPELTEEKRSHQNNSNSSDLKDYLHDMPELCHPYQHELSIQNVLTTFCDSTGSGPKKLVLGGLTGRGKTQACIAFMQLKQDRIKQNITERGKSDFARRLRLLWLVCNSPNALFDSMKRLYECFISGKHQPAFNTSRSAQGAEILAKTVSRWLSEQSTPWLMVIDHIDDCMELENNRDDGLKIADRIKMLEILYMAKNGKIIATASLYPNSVTKSHWQKHALVSMDSKVAMELVHRYLSGNDLSPTFTNDKAAMKLCKLLGFLPSGIAIACSTIKARKVTIDTYIKNWHEVFEDTAKATEQRSLATPLLRCLQALIDTSQRAEELLNILVCLNTPNISEEVFQRAWQSTQFSEGQHLSVPTTQQTQSYKALKVIWNLIGLAPKANDHYDMYSALDFMIPKPGETSWQDSTAKRHLRDTLGILEEASFLQFSQTKTNCEIRVQPIIKAWMRRSYMTGVLRSNINRAWWQASSIIAASLRPTITMPDRNSESFLTFQKHAADQIYQLACMKDSPEFQKNSGDSSGFVSSWTENNLFFDQTGARQIHIADALDLHGYSSLALRLRDAHRQSDSSGTTTLEYLARLTALADSLTQNGRHEEALEERNAALKSVESLSVPTFPGGARIKVHILVRKLYRLIIQSDIAESYSNLFRKHEALELYDVVQQAFAKILEELELCTDGGNTPLRDAISEHFMWAKLGFAECLVYHRQEYDEAKAILGTVLKMPRSPSNIQRDHTYLRARSLSAYIMLVSGYAWDALTERCDILEQWKSKDAEMSHLHTMKAQIDYANGLLLLDDKKAPEQSLRLITEVMERLSKSDRYEATDFFVYTKQDLARCYIKIASSDFDTTEHRYKNQASLKVYKAATLMQEIWKDLQGRDGRGHTHPETLNSLALMIKYERFAELCTGDRSFFKSIHMQALEETRIKIIALEEQSDDVKRAWLYVQLEDCLVNNQAKRTQLLESLLYQMPEESSTTSKDRAASIFYLEVRYQIAMARMAPLYYCRNGKQRNKIKKDQIFADAAKELTKVWKQRYTIWGLGSYKTNIALKSAVRANESVNNNDCITLQAWRCAACAEFCKNSPDILDHEAKILRRLQNERGIKPQKLWTEIQNDSYEWLNRY